MSIMPKPTRKLNYKGETQVWCWQNVGANDQLEPLSLASELFSVQVVGNFDGTIVMLDGSLDGKTFSAIPRGLGEASSIKNSDIFSFSGPIPWIRPRLVGGDATKVDIMLSAVQP